MKVITPFSAEHVSALKGLLIALVVLGHNRVFFEHANDAYETIYSFHVSGFLLLPFLFQHKTLTRQFFFERCVRYLVPFLWFFMLSSVLYFLMFEQELGIIEWIVQVIAALLTMSAKYLDAASGFKMFWFLPALLSMVLLLALWDSVNALQKGAMLILIIAVHLLLGEAEGAWVHVIPLGLPIAFYIMLTGLALRQAKLKEWLLHPMMRVGILMVFALLVAIMNMIPFYVNLGDIVLYGAADLPKLLVQDAMMLFGLLACCVLALYLSGVRLLVLLGKYSLAVYLLHGLVYQLLYLVYPLSHVWQFDAVILFAACILISLGAALVIFALPRVSSLLFPRDWMAFRFGV